MKKVLILAGLIAAAAAASTVTGSLTDATTGKAWTGKLSVNCPGLEEVLANITAGSFSVVLGVPSTASTACVAHFAASTKSSEWHETWTVFGAAVMTRDDVLHPVNWVRAESFSCRPGLGDGLNVIAADTYLRSTCYNDTGVTVTITGIRCFTNNSGTSALSVTNGAGTALLTGAITCSPSFAAGTQSATVTIASGDFLKFSWVADGASKQTAWIVTQTK